MAEWLSSWLAEQEDRGWIPGLATWIFRDWASPASKSRYGWKIAKSTLLLKTTNQPNFLLNVLRVHYFIYLHKFFTQKKNQRNTLLSRGKTIAHMISVYWEFSILLVIRFMADLLRKYRGSVVIMVGRGGAEPHYVHNWPPIFSW